MKEIKKLIFTLFDNDDKFENGAEYYHRELGYYDNDIDIKEAIKKQIAELDNELILNIYTRDILLNIDENKEYSNYSFYDNDGNIISQHKHGDIALKETISEVVDYKVGDIVLIYPDSDNFDDKLEIGIISYIPDNKTYSEPYYTILIGWDLHNHVHMTHQFFTKIIPDHTNDITLKDRLKIGY
jgi:hypothetical protein